MQSKKCLELNSKSIDTLLILGNLYYNLNKEKESEYYYREILKINSKESNAYYSLGYLYKKKRDYEKSGPKSRKARKSN